MELGIFDMISEILSEYTEILSRNKNNKESTVTEINNKYNNLEDYENDTKVVSVEINEKENNETKIISGVLNKGYWADRLKESIKTIIEEIPENENRMEEGIKIIEFNDIKKENLENVEFSWRKKEKKEINLENIGFSWKPDKEVMRMRAKEAMEKYIKSEAEKAYLEELLESELTDLSKGHWDVFNTETDIPSILIGEKKVYGRDPRKDVDMNGTVAIDFGTKSTVAIYRDNLGRFVPLRIGSAGKDLSVKSYENPTMICFMNLEGFLKEYNKKTGRPNTKWSQVKVSEDAKNRLKTSINSVLPDIKQWASSDKAVNIQDENNDYVLRKFLFDFDREDFINPVELYAYYIGLNLNNMCRKKIFLKYHLSYPVTYEREIREKIRKSFEKGIKKSFPNIILEDEKIMKKFSVENFNSEPFCYSAAALEQYNFFNTIKDGEEIFYSIFDFGGGTTDFDFGILKKSDEDRYEHEIESLSSGGHQYLGGENILNNLAYSVFMSESNVEKLRKERIQISLPMGEPEPLRNEDLVNDTKEARMNLVSLSDILRPIWEKNEELDGYNADSGQITVNLFDMDTESKVINLDIEVEKLEEMIKKMIDHGVDSFFSHLYTAMIKYDDKIEKVNIFLAGNSSKSGYLTEILNNKLAVFLSKKPELKNNFVIFPPLGTDEAKKKQEEMGYIANENEFVPDCKTGVAYGSILLRKSGEIKVQKTQEEIPFNFMVGRKKSKEFIDILSKDSEYNEWKKFISADLAENEIYYTDDFSNEVLGRRIINLKHKSITLEDEYEEGKYIYIRSVSPNSIEYCVSDDEKILKDEYIENPVLINLKN